MSKVRSRHNDLLNYFIFKPPKDLSVSYVKQCEKLFKDIEAIKEIMWHMRNGVNERPCNCKKKKEGVQ